MEPITGIDVMRKNAGVFDDYPSGNLLSGPGKLAKSMAIKYRSDNNIDLTNPDSAISIWSTGTPDLTDNEVEATKRIGISQAADLPWRFIVRGSTAVSRR